MGVALQIRRIWKSPSVLALCEQVGESDPLAAMRARAQALVARSGISGPPFSPLIMGSLQGVRRIEFRPIGFDACLIPVSTGFEVHICSNHPEGRQNFSMAHEIGHIFLIEATGHPRTTRREIKIGTHTLDNEEEYLCDFAGSQLLLPSPSFEDDVYAYGPSLRTVLELAKLYRASLQATVLRFVQARIWKCFFLFWKMAPVAGDRQIFVERCVTRGDVGPVLKDEIFLRDEARLLAAIGSRRIIRGREQLSFGGDEDQYYIETIQIGTVRQPRLLSMVVTEPFAEYAVRRRRLPDQQLGLFRADF